MKKIVLVGASGTIGSAVERVLKQAGHEVIPVGSSSGKFQVRMEDRASCAALFKAVGSIDALAVAAGHVAFKPLFSLSADDWQKSLGGKFLGQVNLALEALSVLRDGGSITLITGITSRESIKDGVAAAAVSRAVEGFVMAAAADLPRGIRINVISPTVLEESMADYADYFAGFEPVSGERVGNAYLKAITGRMTGQTLIP
jgi:NAD(P)-dependent dehydrogenase (short-subunit alcohol dehydrogenase family)